MDDEFCHAHSEHLRGRCQQQERQHDARQAPARFSEFVKREESSVLPAMDAIPATATLTALLDRKGLGSLLAEAENNVKNK